MSGLSDIQPMVGPIGGIAFYRPRYASTVGTLAGEPCIVDALGSLATKRKKNPYKAKADADARAAKVEAAADAKAMRIYRKVERRLQARFKR